jgi:hypothetical protein
MDNAALSGQIIHIVGLPMAPLLIRQETSHHRPGAARASGNVRRFAH